MAHLGGGGRGIYHHLVMLLMLYKLEKNTKQKVIDVPTIDVSVILLKKAVTNFQVILCMCVN